MRAGPIQQGLRAVRGFGLGLGAGLALALNLAICGAAGGALWPSAAAAQTAGVPSSQILTIEIDRLFAQSAFGRRAMQELEDEGARVSAQNRQLEAALAREEKTLTERRAELPPEEFRALADAFHAKAQRIRREREVKARELAQQQEALRREFLAAVQPVLEGIMREAGAVVIMDRRNLFFSADVIDVTEVAIQRVDAAIGAGQPAEPRPGAGEAAIPVLPRPVAPDAEEGEAGTGNEAREGEATGGD